MQLLLTSVRDDDAGIQFTGQDAHISVCFAII